MIFDVTIEDYCRKDRLVAGGHMTETPATMTYAILVYRESVKLALMLADLNALDVKCEDAKNAYITAPVTSKVSLSLVSSFPASHD